MNTVELAVQGMTCGSCVKHVTKALQAVAGVDQVEVDLATGRALVKGDLQAGAAPLIEALANEDYPAKIAPDAVTTAAPKTSGCQPNPSGKSGCCCG
jgi:copper chaperone CopZ